MGLDFKSNSVADSIMNALPLDVTTILVNNKGYPIHHHRMDKYQNKDITTKLQDFRFTVENKEVCEPMYILKMIGHSKKYVHSL